MRVIFMVFCAFVLVFGGESVWAGQGVRLLAGAGLRPGVEEAVKIFSQEKNIKVFVDYAGSGQLLARYLASHKGGVFLPGAMFYIRQLQRKGMVRGVVLVARHTPVVAVNRTKASLVNDLSDLARPGLRVGLGDPKAMALGRMAREILCRAGIEKAVERNVVVRAATVKQLAFYVAQGMVDAAIIACSDAFLLRDRLKMLPIDPRLYTQDFIAAALLTTAACPSQARALQQFLGSKRVRKIFEKYGFLPVDGARR